jgi:F-box/leucine-rich repeat protein 2/20
MEKLNISSFEKIIPFIDYLTLYQFKYTSKNIMNKFKELDLFNCLDLRNTKYKNENNTIYTILSKHKFLTKIILEFRPINDTHIYKFTNNITYININYCQNITDSGLIYISENCLNLTHLELYVLQNITDKGLSPIIKNCSKLIYLNLSGCRHIGDESLMLLTKYLPNLEFLDLTRCILVSDEFLIELAKNNLKLKHLNLYALPELKCTFLKYLNGYDIEFLDFCGNEYLNDELFENASSHLKKLKSLNISWCNMVTDKSIKFLFENNNESKLELFSVHGILGITDESIKILEKNEGVVKNLNAIDIVACINVKNNSNEYLKKKFPKLEVFQVFF